MNNQTSAAFLNFEDQHETDIVYSDVDLGFSPHPISGDISILENVNAVKKAIKYLILTNFNERPFAQNFGSPVSSNLFELLNIDFISISESIRRTIQINEPRVIVEDVWVNSEKPDAINDVKGEMLSKPNFLNESNTLYIIISFRVKHFKELVTLNISLKRTR